MSVLFANHPRHQVALDVLKVLVARADFIPDDPRQQAAAVEIAFSIARTFEDARSRNR